MSLPLQTMSISFFSAGRQTLRSNNIPLRPMTSARRASSSGSSLSVPRRAMPVTRSSACTSPPIVRQSRSAVLGRRYASSSADSSSTTDPGLERAVTLLDEGTKMLEEGDLDGARGKYKQSLDVKPTSGGWFNLGVCEYHLNKHSAAIEAWEKSIALSPSADAYTNLASAYVMSKPPQPALAIKHLTSALSLSPEDPEIAFNLAAILESTDNLEPALQLYEKAQKGGIDRAAQNIRSVSAKILAKKASSQPSASQ